MVDLKRVNNAGRVVMRSSTGFIARAATYRLGTSRRLRLSSLGRMFIFSRVPSAKYKARSLQMPSQTKTLFVHNRHRFHLLPCGPPYLLVRQVSLDMLLYYCASRVDQPQVLFSFRQCKGH